ncbi:MAG: hypothetical protein P8Y62_08180 [candidate division WOR-3 bacterium]|jgi:hypothetical protein
MKKNIFFTIAGWSFVIYSLIEINDCICAVLMAFHVIENPYPVFYYQPVNLIFENHPVYLIPLFLAITGLRIFSAVGLLRYKEWGFWIGISIIFITYIWVPFMLPLSVFDFLFCSIILVFLVIGRYGSINDK